ncbi:MAG TPA: hypothetical protein V6C86_06375 [Oculatellaceae cyanobacterium]
MRTINGGIEMAGGFDSRRYRYAPKPELGKKPQASDFTGEAVSRAVLKETLEHPATIYPAAGSAVALAWTLMVGLSPASVAFGLGCAFIGASSFIYNYVIKGPDRATAYIAKLRELRRTHSLIELDDLGQKCRKAGLREGFTEAGELKDVYQHLTGYLESHKDSMSADRFLILAEDTLQEAIRILNQALEIYSSVEAMDVQELQNEIASLKHTRGTVDDKNPMAKAIDSQIESGEKRMSLYTQQQSELTQLFSQISDIESALRSSYVDLVGMQNQSLSAKLNDNEGAAGRLKSAVEVARRVEARLRGDDNEDQARREKYLKAYQNTVNQETSQSREEQQ